MVGGELDRRRPAFRIESEEDEIVVRLRRGVLGPEEVSKFLDYLVLESIRKRSRLTGADARALADEIDRSVWAKVGRSARDGNDG